MKIKALWGYMFLVLFGAIIAIVGFYFPYALSNKNEFLESYVNHEMVNVFGVIAAIVLPTVGLYIRRVSELAAKHNDNPKAYIGASRLIYLAKRAASLIIIIFALAFMVAFLKGLASVEAIVPPELSEGFVITIHGIAIFLHFSLFLILSEIVNAFFAVEQHL